MTTDPATADADLLDEVQRVTFGYFWDFAHPVSGLARDRARDDADPGDDVAAIGGTGFGVMAIVVAVERGWITRSAALERLLAVTDFLLRAERFHGVFPHFMNGATGAAIARERDAGVLGCAGRYPEPAARQRCADLFETQYVMERNVAVFTRLLLAAGPLVGVALWAFARRARRQ